jgi:hypothetical protein
MRSKTVLLLAVAFLIILVPHIGRSAQFHPSIQGVIFTAEETEVMIKRIAVPDLKPPFWTPTVEQVLKLERRLPEAVSKDYGFQLKRDLFLFYRQYFGITEGGVKKIYANFFCEQYWKYNDDWRSKVVAARLYVQDCFFVVTYDPSTGQFSDILRR